jgi:HlyD family secretion protein
MAMKRKLIVFALILGSVVGAGAFYRARGSDTPRYQTVAVTRGSIVDAIEATGTLEPVDPVQIGSQVSGTVVSLGTDFNQQVKKGQIVAVLDPALLQAQVDQAQATVTRLQAEVERARIQVVDAQQKLARSQALAKEQLIPQQDLDASAILRDANQAALKSAQANLVQAQASLEQSRVNLGHTIIKAPDDGVVLSRTVEIGQTVAASMQTPTLFVIARDLKTMRVNASVDESDIGRVKEGQDVTFTVDAYGQEVFTGKVTEVRLQPVVTSGVVSYPTVIAVPNASLRLKPGMTATVSIEVARQDDVLRVPVSATRFRPTDEQLAESGIDPATIGGGRTRGANRANGANATNGANGTNAANGAGTANAARESNRANRANGASQTNAADGSTAPNAANAGNGQAGANAERGARRNTRVIWQQVNGQLKPVRVHVGLSNATHVALVDGGLEEGAEVITGIAQATMTSSQQPATNSPLMPSMPRRQGGGGGGGGGRR